MVDTTKRICQLCGSERTGNGGISVMADRRGIPLGLFGSCCYGAIRKAIDESPRRYGLISSDEMRQMILDRAKIIRHIS